MGLLTRCEACAAKDAELEFLRAHVRDQAKVISELGSPLVQARIAQAERGPRPMKADQQPAQRASAQMFRHTRADRPETPMAPGTDVEATFTRNK